MPEIPYQDDQVTEILIEGAPDWIPVKRGTFQAIEVGFEKANINEDARTRMGLTAVDKMDGSEVFFYVERLIAVKYTFEESHSASGVHTADGRLLP
jgi:hypothetical protein